MFLHFIYSAVIIGVIFLIARQFEKRNPIEAKQSTTGVIVDSKLAGLKWVTKPLLSPIINTCSITIINAAGGGWINPRSDGWWFLVSLVVVILAIDFWGYLLHRAAHKFPVLWAMHSLHHSAESLSIITGARLFWLEEPLYTVFPILGIIFKVPPEMTTPILLLYFLLGDGLVHLNLRMSLGRFVLCLNNPQYHRIHHSIEPQHQKQEFLQNVAAVRRDIWNGVEAGERRVSGDWLDAA